MPEVSFTHRTSIVLDARTAAEVMRLAEASTPPRTQAEMWRHLIRLGLVEYRRQAGPFNDGDPKGLDPGIDPHAGIGDNS